MRQAYEHTQSAFVLNSHAHKENRYNSLHQTNEFGTLGPKSPVAWKGNSTSWPETSAHGRYTSVYLDSEVAVRPRWSEDVASPELLAFAVQQHIAVGQPFNQVFEH